MANFYPSQPQDAPVLIYALCEPDDAQCVRYIGQTTKTLEQRLAMHLTEAAQDAPQKRTYARLAWLRSLLADGKQPIVRLLTTTDREHANAVERATIEDYEARGVPLTNGTYSRASREQHRVLSILYHRAANHKMRSETENDSGIQKAPSDPRFKTIPLRLSLDMHAALVERARRNGRSLQKEIVAELEQAEDADFIARYGPAIRREVNAVLAEQPRHE